MTTREKNQLRLLELLAQSSCVDCGNNDLRVLTFDHIDPKKKKATVSTLVHQGHSWDIIMREIKRTEICCHNCHVKRECEREGSRRQLYWLMLQNDN